ncbi:MAG: DPP IV N-terminal domain-containing protein, partial [Bacteroidales bacterium]|nr:DPP IV N-terminal domain-containing protein [Bacteroidales bacterium]
MKKLLMIVTFAALVAGGTAEAQKQNITLEDIWTQGTFRARGIGGIRSMADGEHYLSMTRTGISKYSYLTGEKVEDICGFGGPAERLKAKPLPPMESYQMSADEQKILLSSGFEPLYRHSGVSDYWIYDLKDKSFTQISKTGKQRLTTLSPDGTKVAFVRDNNLYWMDLATLEEHAITTDGKVNEIINGTTDWVYEEEFAITQGFQWSPDSKKIAYMRFDESQVKEYNMQMWGALYPEDYKYKYPKAGEDNSKVEMWVYYLDHAKGSRIAATDKTWEYIPRFQWTPSGTLTYMLMNRLQNHMQILTSEGKMLYEEQCDTYVEVPDTWQFITVGKGKKAQQQMLITSERDGYRHIYLYDMQGNMVKQVTSGDWEVCDVPGIDVKNQRLYYTSREHHPTQKSLFVIGFDGKKKQCLNDVTRNVKNTEDRYVLGTYNATFS